MHIQADGMTIGARTQHSGTEDSDSMSMSLDCWQSLRGTGNGSRATSALSAIPQKRGSSSPIRAKNSTTSFGLRTRGTGSLGTTHGFCSPREDFLRDELSSSHFSIYGASVSGSTRHFGTPSTFDSDVHAYFMANTQIGRKYLLANATSFITDVSFPPHIGSVAKENTLENTMIGPRSNFEKPMDGNLSLHSKGKKVEQRARCITMRKEVV
ncbi:hypothetical protein K440DRAFT_646012 [Wilcoxina mikolae CBS 423.85]|nr:hypothetical protein K440DRAFT_646012 [Wilcoxina mikolae CBS 423.85]